MFARPRFSSVPCECVRPRCSSLVCERLREPSKDETLELEAVRERSLVILALDTGERGDGGFCLQCIKLVDKALFIMYIFFSIFLALNTCGLKNNPFVNR